MKNPNLCIHVSPDGDVKVLVASMDADEALQAYKAHDAAGKTLLYVKPVPDRHKSSGGATKKRAKKKAAASK